MILNDEEKRILDGKSGRLAQKCMEYLVAYGEAAGAECLVDIDGTVDIHPGSNPCWVPDYQITNEEILTAARRGEQFKVPTFGNKPVPALSWTVMKAAEHIPLAEQTIMIRGWRRWNPSSKWE